MLISPLMKRNTTTFLLYMIMVIPIVRLYGQDKPQVVPPSKSDSFVGDGHGKRFRVQHHEVAGTNFQIAGVDLTAKEELIPQVIRVLGKVTTVASGSESESIEEACYRSTDANDSTYLTFRESVVVQSFTLSSDGSVWKWTSPCKQSLKISRNLATASGLHLGQTQEQVIAILGLPTRHSRNVKNGRDDLVYSLEARKKTDPRDLAIWLQEEMQKSQTLTEKEREYIVKDFHESNDFYDLSIDIYAKFIYDSLTNLEVSWSATY